MHCALRGEWTVEDPDTLTILVADDSPVYRKLVEQSLAEQSRTLLLAKNGRQAIDLFAEHQPALVITDWTMPDISGIELCQRIRHDFQQSHAYLILVTSHAEKEQVILGLDAGADDYLTKPFHPGELLARVRVGRRMIGMHREIQAKNRQLEELALTDVLTGLPNRRAIELWATREVWAAARHDFSIWIVMADLDHFKKVNDTYGHEADETVLRGFAEILKTNTRHSNMCGRMGGEEFLLILTHVEREHIVIAIERIRKEFEMRQFTFCSQSLRATASFGIAGFRGTAAPDLSTLIACADVALYSAKHRGRNCIELAAPA
jgi:two-component system, cell cycle response regulator